MGVSVFDPSTSMICSFNGISCFYILLFMPSMYWLVPSRWNMILLSLVNYLMKKFNKFINLFKIIFFIMLHNLLGLFSYILTSTSHLVVSLSMSLPLWISYMIFGWLKNMNHMFIHLVPQGTPGILTAIMVLLETISNVIRPGSLSVRLAANMIAGHLISSTGVSLNLFMLILMILVQSLSILLKLSVAFIQAYVFSFY